MAVGFEITTNIKAYVETPGRTAQGSRPLVELPKEFCLYGDRNGVRGWSLETDGADVELVTEPPFEETDAGRHRLIQVFDDMTRYFRAVDRIRQSRSGIKRRHVTEIRSGERSYRDLFNPHVTRGFHLQLPNPAPGQTQARPIVGTPQATVGIRLGRLRALFEEMARLGDRSLFEQTGAPWYTRKAQTAADLARQAKPVQGTPASERLKGLLTLLGEYMTMGASTTQPRAYVKYMTFAMARTDFAKMFKLLRPTEYDWFSSPLDPNKDRWVTYVLDAMGMQGTENERLIQFRITDGKLLPDEAVTIPLTRGEWLRGMARGTNPLDRLTMSATAADPAYQDVSGGHRLRALGGLGSKTDRVSGGTKEGIVIEFRTLRQGIPWQEWKRLALELFDYTKALNESSKRGPKPQLPGWNKGTWL